jgi:L-asparaginase
VTEGVAHIALEPRRRYRLREWPRGDARVALAAVGFGDDGSLLRLVAASDFDGAVVEAMGGGHVPIAVAAEIGGLAARLPVVLASRTRAGVVLTRTYGFPGSEVDLLERGVVTAGSLDAPKARVLLAALLAGGGDRAEISTAFEAFGGRSRQT